MQSVEVLPSIKRLRAFDAVARAGSALAAASQLRVSQPAVTYSLDNLEEQLGVRLLDRGAGGSFPTPEGEMFRNRTGRFFEQVVEAIRDALSGSQATEKADLIATKLRETQMRSLIAVWKAGGFRLAAKQLGVAEPSLQRPAREIERLLRVGLYRRTASGMETNAVGAELARRLALAFGEIRSGIEEIGAGHMQSRAGLRVGVLALSPRMILAEAMATLLKDRPSQRVDVIEGAYEEQADALRAGAIDVIFGALRTPPPFPDIVEERMIEDPYAIVCRVGHPLARRKNIAASDLAGYDFVLPTEGLPRRAVLDRFLSVSKIKPKSRIETSCLATIVAILRTSDRLSLLSRWHAELDGWSDLFCLERIDVPHPPRFVGLSTRAGWLPTPFQREFLVLTRAAVAKRIAPRERIVATNVVL